MIGRGGLGHGSELDAGVGGQVGAELAGLALVVPCVVAVEVRVALAVAARIERQDRDGRLLAVTGGETEVTDGGLIGAVGTLVDLAAGAGLGRGAGIEPATTTDAFTKVHCFFSGLCFYITTCA